MSRGSGPTGALLYRLELSYKGHPTTFIGKICWKEQILPRNLLNLGRASEVEFFKFYYQDKMIIVKTGFVKISVDQTRPLKSYNEIMDKHSF